MEFKFGATFGIFGVMPVVECVLNEDDPCLSVSGEVVDAWLHGTVATAVGLVELSADKQYLRIDAWHFRFYSHIETTDLYVYYFVRKNDARTNNP